MNFIRIIGKTYSINWVDKPILRADECGACDFERQTITVQNGYHAEQERDTLLHEVLHGIEHEMGLELDEATVRLMATGLFAVLKDNPWFMDYLKGQDDQPAAT